MLTSYYPKDLPELVSKDDAKLQNTSSKGILHASFTYTVSTARKEMKDICIGWVTILLIIVFASVNFIILQNGKSIFYLGALSTQGDFDIVVRSASSFGLGYQGAH